MRQFCEVRQPVFGRANSFGAIDGGRLVVTALVTAAVTAVAVAYADDVEKWFAQRRARYANDSATRVFMRDTRDGQRAARDARSASSSATGVLWLLQET